ncbi:MAG: DUF4956 domain-containing protein [Deltaproteobacteria bacterium]|nr:DUF4956 domain-containing protein [Deltaproteobacteria bacterium]
MNAETSFFLDKLLRTAEPGLFSVGDLFLSMTVASLLAFVLSSVYRHTHRGTSYSQSFLVTMFMMAVATSVVMLIIGSNIARAFSLVGALSVIRFRTAVKDARDTGYLFAAMVAGMGCGTQFYLAAISMVGFLSALLVGLYHADFGLKKKMESIVRVTFDKEGGAEGRVEAALAEIFADVRLVNRVLDIAEGADTNVYVVRPKGGVAPSGIEEKLRQTAGVRELALYQSDQHAPF